MTREESIYAASLMLMLLIAGICIGLIIGNRPKTPSEQVTAENWECSFYNAQTGQCLTIERRVK